ncbi:3-deoxy-D-manno-octulosonic acid transferase [Shimia sediminis]|uniref:3-deoxy-D-manno-octulosonic acid transferase n=1 Tax=Shimia sediminis TaxID=2497945 RepID=UPI000F8E56AB|nr:3-deoxy-D-manno-octulosonic acid transferase [Shimia sediminis]
MGAAPLTLTYHLYRAVTALAAPLALRAARKRFIARNGPMTRFPERNGRFSEPRPAGPLIWLHAVSVGEFLSILDLVRDLTQDGTKVLVTTTTSSAAELAAQRLPSGVLHQFAPVDTPGAVRRFLDHWHPDLAVFVESEIWPNQIVMAHKRGIPLALINARLSGKSLEQWQKHRSTARALLSRFSRILCQTDTTRNALIQLSSDDDTIETTGDMKAAAGALPYDPSEVERLAPLLAKRPLWVASSTHEGEEDQVSAAHRAVIREHADALLILVPRHPERGDAIEALLKQKGWTIARRSRGDLVAPDTQVYLADTLGETGLWYHLSPIVLVGGSFTPVGGHNPYEPAHFGCAILHGPLYANFTLAYEAMRAAGACEEVEDAAALGGAVADLIRSDRQQNLARNASAFIDQAGNNRAGVVSSLISLMK